jgi:hypothetical protein
VVEVLIFIENEPKGIPLKFDIKSSTFACGKIIKQALPRCGDRI